MGKGIGKRGDIHKIITEVLRFFTSRKTIVFDAPHKFHFSHVEPVINKLIQSYEKDYKIIVICAESTQTQHDNITYLTSIEQLTFWQKIDLFVTTEFYRELPFWLTTKAIYFGHGIGPKLNYQTQELLAPFDFIFAPALPFYELQKKLFPADNIFKVGLPMLDQITSDTNKIEQHFSLNSDLPTLVYAPSWCSYTELITDLHQAFHILNKIENFNVIVSPHPLLFEPSRCGGLDFFNNDKQYEKLWFNLPETGISTLDIVALSDVVISDISSISFEAMALNKIVLLEDNKAMFDKFGALEVFDELSHSCQMVNWESCNINDLLICYTYDNYQKSRKAFIENYLFNNGQATNIFIEKINEIISKEP
jgi:hypothetical protein